MPFNNAIFLCNICLGFFFPQCELNFNIFLEYCLQYFCASVRGDNIQGMHESKMNLVVLCDKALLVTFCLL